MVGGFGKLIYLMTMCGTYYKVDVPPLLLWYKSLQTLACSLQKSDIPVFQVVIINFVRHLLRISAV